MRRPYYVYSTDNPNEFKFISGSISIEIDSITETSLEQWKQQQAEEHSINILPETKPAHEKLEALLEVCEYIRNCLDVGGEQSRQFADEIACLSEAVKEAKR